MQADMNNDEDVKTLLETTVRHFGKLDILVNGCQCLLIKSLCYLLLAFY